MSQAITPDFLRGLAFFWPATDAELAQLAAVGRSEHHEAGTILFREGTHLRHFYIVVSGNVAIEIYGPDRRTRRIHTVGPGELLGWSPVLGSSAMTATARALTEVQVVALDANAVRTVCDADPRFGYIFMKRLAIAIAARLNATRLHLLDVFGTEIPALPLGGGL